VDPGPRSSKDVFEWTFLHLIKADSNCSILILGCRERLDEIGTGPRGATIDESGIRVLVHLLDRVRAGHAPIDNLGPWGFGGDALGFWGSRRRRCSRHRRCPSLHKEQYDDQC
jgi:hypothetical protein